MFPGGMLWSGAGSRQNLFEMVPNDPMHHFLPSITCTTFSRGSCARFLNGQPLLADDSNPAQALSCLEQLLARPEQLDLYCILVHSRHLGQFLY